MVLEAELQTIFAKLGPDRLREADARDQALIATYKTAADALRSAVEALYGRDAPGGADEDTCSNCHGARWRREGPSGIACAECGTLAVGVPIA